MKWLLSLCLMYISYAVSAQEHSGTYYWQNKTGANATITLMQTGKTVETDVFAWWHTRSERKGVFTGAGTLNNSKVSFTPGEEWQDTDPGKNCKVLFTLSKNALKAVFNDCMAYNLPEDFNGDYKKISTNVKGIYIVSTAKSFIYREMNETAKHAAYLVKGDTVLIENIAGNNWGYTNYTHHNHTTSGFLKLNTLQFIQYKP